MVAIAMATNWEQCVLIHVHLILQVHLLFIVNSVVQLGPHKIIIRSKQLKMILEWLKASIHAISSQDIMVPLQPVIFLSAVRMREMHVMVVCAEVYI